MMALDKKSLGESDIPGRGAQRGVVADDQDLWVEKS